MLADVVDGFDCIILQLRNREFVPSTQSSTKLQSSSPLCISSLFVCINQI